ncbi:1,4-alpha-glucan branching protein GlgB [Clostridium perfringens]|uniref:1,4-alpha-glucan branching enzyme GlgB 2 n=1 Tax=Clostridium perfringens (strain SM101 / Type A) TaxID=289380 RepID=GLGB2_CLOPS|nr:1,4-alpha-glucan branching protein GlgB [Clostridium perfringens]Q0SSN2.1 RecName: Full=1,4-alpha-glucan branching enzyme GlgB 2; AltName: Full=1,4-alpha-D-glucan:1,4-alpha-D-glucan 6-glucosyl-transferase 2; AltName: Full=Alpha-(1->4)-glucan branching enzyme 2; AltName: Full=Glycogen branching enzyme 2; Short=BE 2 [Clostridium perfringens SM101]ABG87715.1 1,4-alpha-glucan branching enzyme [Clostridium perfringens SM101]EJT5917434.1 1,4-alpha-glucan branching protein GlgB [Clostridium perfring
MRNYKELKHEKNGNVTEKIGENKGKSKKMSKDESLLSFDLFLEGKEHSAYKFMGAHFITENRKRGVRFTTWSPRASKIYIIGDFNNWELKEEYSMKKINERGIWSLFIPKLEEGIKYKFAVENECGNNTVYKSDPYAFKSELRPNTASVLTKIKSFRWGDKRWLNKREKEGLDNKPMNIYELHLGSWKRKDGEFMTYEEISEVLVEYIKEMGYTHVEFMPVNEHPLDASWGYQGVGYYSVTSRYGDLNGLKTLINKLHKNNIGVLLDWVPSHFCKDEHGLFMFDGSPTYEYEVWWKANNEGWGTCNFDLGRPEVKSFLFSNAMYWINEFHVDGLRVDAVSNMLYLDYGREYGEWEPNIYGENGNLEAIAFLKELNTIIKKEGKGAITVAEESTSWEGITKSVEEGGLGFDYKWNMGWMNDTLSYIELDPIYRKYHHNKMNFSMMYNYSEKFILPISHDEVVHGKKSLINKMWGDDWKKYAGLRLYASFMMGHPGKKLMFMGCEFGQFVEWREWEELQWSVIEEFDIHRKTKEYFKALNKFYLENSSLWSLDYEEEGFKWMDADNSEESVLSFIRIGKNKKEKLIFICNFTPEVYYDFKVGVPELGEYVEVFNSDSLEFGGVGNIMGDSILKATEESFKDFDYSISVKVPPLGTLVLKVK